MLVDTVSRNTLRAIRFERPEYIPIFFWVNPACRHHYKKDALFELMSEHSILFAEFDPENEQLETTAPWERAGVPYTDAWGCVWETTDDGITGTVTRHPLADWSTLESFTAPDPDRTNGMTEIEFSAISNRVSKARSEGKSCRGCRTPTDSPCG